MNSSILSLPTFNSYYSGPLQGSYDAYTKLDGVCVHMTPDGAFSKRGKPLYNMPQLAPGYYEAFDTDWDTSVSKARTQSRNKGVFTPSQLYPIYPITTPDLFLTSLTDPTEQELKDLLESQLALKHEGVVIWPTGYTRSKKPIKVKQTITIDIEVTGIQPGTGKYLGMMGALLTRYGKIGTGFTDADRQKTWVAGQIIEVTFMEWTKGMKMRHPRFIRERWDKSEENLEIEPRNN